MYTNTSEKAFESLIIESLVNEAGYQLGDNKDYDREHAIDSAKLLDFLQITQADTLESIGIVKPGPKRSQFLHRLQGEITKRGVVDVLRKGIKNGPASLDLFYGTPSPGNTKAAKRYAENIFSVTRQLHYSRDNTQLSLDFVIFINGLPIATFELKNQFTKQTVEDAVEQYKNDRNPRELLFQFGRCLVHFAVDDHQVRMCTELKAKQSWFLPFNKGYNDGAGNPPNPHGIATDYLWREILIKDRLTDILENYAQVVVKKNDKTGKKERKQIFPRYHQLSVVRKLLADVRAVGVGKRYLIQHSAGSGKSNSIAWLAHQLVGLEKGGKVLFDSIIIITDRRVLDKQIRDTIKQFAQVSAIVGHAEDSGDLRKFIQDGKKIIISTVQKFPFVLNEIGNAHRQNRFAIIIDEAHSSQGGQSAGKMNQVLADAPADYRSDTDTEDKINHLMATRKMLKNASYFAFTATPKNKTLEIFSQEQDENNKHYPFHSYTMKQAIQEGFIMDVLEHYTPINSYYRLIKTIADDPLFDKKKAQKKLRRYVESNDHAIRIKAEIMIDHFHTKVMGQKPKIGGKARAMVINGSIQQAIQYFHTFNAYLKERKSPYKAIVAFSGEPTYQGQKVTEASLNHFPSSQIPDKFQQEPYRFLIVADKFQTGYDEPLLHTLYVDKPLSGIKTVQTLSRINRAHPQKHDCFVLDFFNDADTIEAAFADYYRTTLLSSATDPNKLHDLKADLDAYQVYNPQQIDNLVEYYLDGANRDKLDPILDTCVALYKQDLDEDGQVDFKSKAKAFVRTHGFLSAILDYSNLDWEKLAIFLNFLIPKLPAPIEKDLSRGILETVDMDSYRAEVKNTLHIKLPDENSEIEPYTESGGGRKPEPEQDNLSQIIQTFNELWGSSIQWNDKDKIIQLITEELPAKVNANTAYQNAKHNNNKQTARIEHDNVLEQEVISVLNDSTEFFKQFNDNPAFRKWVSDTIFNDTYQSI